MRWSPALLVASLLTSVAPAAAGPFGTSGPESFAWANGESKAFELTWNGSHGAFTIAGLGTTVYGSLLSCCTDVFDRVRETHPTASLTFTDLAINTLPVNTVLHDSLNLSLLRQGALDNLGMLTGSVTLHWDDPFARMPHMAFDAGSPVEYGAQVESFASQEMQPNLTNVPEPATLLLLGSGLVGLSALARRRTRRQSPQ